MLLAKFQAFYNKTWPQSTLTWGGKGGGIWNLLDFQILPQQVLSRLVV